MSSINCRWESGVRGLGCMPEAGQARTEHISGRHTDSREIPPLIKAVFSAIFYYE